MRLPRMQADWVCDWKELLAVNATQLQTDIFATSNAAHLDIHTKMTYADKLTPVKRIECSWEKVNKR